MTLRLLSVVPHQHLYIHVSLDRYDRFFRKAKILNFLKEIPKVKDILTTPNHPQLGEVPGFKHLRKHIDFSSYEIATYIHSKGVTKPLNPNISDWVELMRYFVVERHDLCIRAFDEGYQLYGVRLARYKGGKRINCYRFSDFWYAGNFVSVNLEALREQFLSTEVPEDYYGVEGFWGRLCPYEKAYCAHSTPFSLHDHPYPPELYRDDM